MRKEGTGELKSPAGGTTAVDGRARGELGSLNTKRVLLPSGGWGGDVCGLGLGREGRCLPEPKLEVTSGDTVDRRRVPILRHVCSQPASWPPGGDYVLNRALWHSEQRLCAVPQSRQSRGVLCLGAWLYGAPRGNVMSDPPLFILESCVSPEAQGKVFPEETLSFNNMLV